MGRNVIEVTNMTSMIFTAAPDLTAEFPAVASRTKGLSQVPLLCASDIAVPDSMLRRIRVWATAMSWPAALSATVNRAARDNSGPTWPSSHAFSSVSKMLGAQELCQAPTAVSPGSRVGDADRTRGGGRPQIVDWTSKESQIRVT